MEHSKNSRIEYIDIAKEIAILLVLLGHLIDFSTLKTIIYSFHMPLFFILSGMLIKPGKLLEKTNRRINNIIVPYVLWAVIYAGFSFKKLPFIFYGTNECLL